MNNPYYDVTKPVVKPDDSSILDYVRPWYATQATLNHCAIQHDHWCNVANQYYSHSQEQLNNWGLRIKARESWNMVSVIRAEIDYRRFGELLPDCD